MKKIGVVRFPGTNCDRDIWQAIEEAGNTPSWMWHKDCYDWQEFDSIIIPGGFSYGDYLYAGALAAKSFVMKTVIEAAGKGVPILGICNGFQILCNCGLLPGVLVRNKSVRFIDEWVELEMKTSCAEWTCGYDTGETLRLPIAHGEGCYYLEEKKLQSLYSNDQVWLKYKNNPNGSVDDIAGVLNKEGNVAGLMPHPERAMFPWMGGEDGVSFFNRDLLKNNDGLKQKPLENNNSISRGSR